MNISDNYLKAGLVLFSIVCLAVFYLAWKEPTMPDDLSMIPMKILNSVGAIKEKDKQIQVIDSAEKIINALLLKKPNDPSLIFCRGLYYTFKEKYAEAISVHSRNFKSIDPHNNSLVYSNTQEELARNYFLLGSELLEGEKKDTLAAINSFHKSFEYIPYFGMTARKLGLLMINNNQTDSAKAILTESIKLYPQDAVLYNILGFAYFKENNLPDAEKCFVQSHNIDPDNEDANKFLSMFQNQPK